MNDLKAILENPAVSAEQKQRLRASGGDPGFSEAAESMLRTLGRSHLVEVSIDEWERYSRDRGVPEDLCQEFWSWHCDDEFLRLVGESRRWYWQRVRHHATSNDVRAHAIKQIAEARSDGA